MRNTPKKTEENKKFNSIIFAMINGICLGIHMARAPATKVKRNKRSAGKKRNNQRLQWQIRKLQLQIWSGCCCCSCSCCCWIIISRQQQQTVNSGHGNRCCWSGHKNNNKETPALGFNIWPSWEPQQSEKNLFRLQAHTHTHMHIVLADAVQDAMRVFAACIGQSALQTSLPNVC